MHDIRALRENPDLYDAAWARRGLPPMAKKIIELDGVYRTALKAKQDHEANRNAVSKAIGAAKARKDEAAAAVLMKEVGEWRERIDEAARGAEIARGALDDILTALPNIPDLDVPTGSDENANAEIRRWYLEMGKSAPSPELEVDHVSLGEALGMMDFESAARISGARFVALKGPLAKLERALAAFMLDMHTSEFGYIEVSPPLLVNEDAAFGTGQLPKFADDLFVVHTVDHDAIRNLYYDFGKQAGIAAAEEAHEVVESIKEQLLDPAAVEGAVEGFKKELAKLAYERDLPAMTEASLAHHHQKFLIPTAEVSLTNLVLGQILENSALPIRMTADTPCFRSEAGSAGRDTRGMIRMHQFRKVELVSITTPEQSPDEHERMLGVAEEVLKRLELPFRTMMLCTGDMGFTAKKTYDLEVWLPSQGKYREISSCSNCGDFQARRMNARFRNKDGKTEFVHTLNGSGLAVGRTLVAVLENYQQADGSIKVPTALVPYMGGLEVIAKA